MRTIWRLIRAALGLAGDVSTVHWICTGGGTVISGVVAWLASLPWWAIGSFALFGFVATSWAIHIWGAVSAAKNDKQIPTPVHVHVSHNAPPPEEPKPARPDMTADELVDYLVKTYATTLLPRTSALPINDQSSFAAAIDLTEHVQSVSNTIQKDFRQAAKDGDITVWATTRETRALHNEVPKDYFTEHDFCYLAAEMIRKNDPLYTDQQTDISLCRVAGLSNGEKLLVNPMFCRSQVEKFSPRTLRQRREPMSPELQERRKKKWELYARAVVLGNKDPGGTSDADIDAFLEADPEYFELRKYMPPLTDAITMWARIAGPMVHPRVQAVGRAIEEWEKDQERR